MSRSSLSVVTGAFGYSGKYIARRLLEQGATVKTLTRTPTSHSPFGDRVEALPLDFGDFNGLVENLRGAATYFPMAPAPRFANSRQDFNSFDSGYR